VEGEETVSLQGHTAGVAEAAFSADGKLVLTASNDKTSIWSTESGRRVAVFDGLYSSVAALTPDGRRLVTAGRKHPDAHVWDVASSAEIAALNGHTAPLTDAVFSPDGQQVITASEDGTARVWSAESGQGIAILKGHDGAVTSVAFSPDGSLAATTSADMTARLWQVHAKQR
jgi:WD40 repeat protein